MVAAVVSISSSVGVNGLVVVRPVASALANGGHIRGKSGILHVLDSGMDLRRRNLVHLGEVNVDSVDQKAIVRVAQEQVLVDHATNERCIPRRHIQWRFFEPWLPESRGAGAVRSGTARPQMLAETQGLTRTEEHGRCDLQGRNHRKRSAHRSQTAGTYESVDLEYLSASYSFAPFFVAEGNLFVREAMQTETHRQASPLLLNALTGIINADWHASKKGVVLNVNSNVAVTRVTNDPKKPDAELCATIASRPTANPNNKPNTFVEATVTDGHRKNPKQNARSYLTNSDIASGLVCAIWIGIDHRLLTMEGLAFSKQSYQVIVWTRDEAGRMYQEANIYFGDADDNQRDLDLPVWPFLFPVKPSTLGIETDARLRLNTITIKETLDGCIRRDRSPAPVVSLRSGRLMEPSSTVSSKAWTK
ncbi:unnamed protein product (mitochondrion) [Plasmodiophora brassicae]|uniref:Uncharacterized protein n=1 Tax=Plasmodiophora brassicae TaxID=37360 RepID=A0A3P3YDP0_PLABS|nr:unnamed protein product [Plasmodiophora brassicae]